MAKIVIPKSQLGPINAENNSHVFRFRIASVEGNVWSYWSPWYEQPNSVQTFTQGNSSMTKLSTIITVKWTATDGFSTYDVYHRWFDNLTINSYTIASESVTIDGKTMTIKVLKIVLASGTFEVGDKVSINVGNANVDGTYEVINASGTTIRMSSAYSGTIGSTVPTAPNNVASKIFWYKDRIIGNSISLPKKTGSLCSIVVKAASYPDQSGATTVPLLYSNLNVYEALNVPTA